MQFFFIVHFDNDPGGLAQDIHALYKTVHSVRSLHLVSGMRKRLVEFLISLRLVLEAAHEPAAHTRDLAGIEGQVLLFCHFDGNGNKIREPGVAAKRSAAASVAAQDLGLIADADLAQFDSGTENAGKVLDKLTEVDASVRSEIKEDLSIVKGVFRVDQLHFEAALLDTVPADQESFALTLLVSFLTLVILRRADTDHRLQGLLNIFFVDLHGRTDNKAVLHSPRSLHDDMHSAGKFKIPRIEIIDFSGCPEAHSNYPYFAGFSFFHK